MASREPDSTPVPETTPMGTASPWDEVARSTSVSVAPPSTRTMPVSSSTSTAFSAPRSSTMPPSTVPLPATL